MWFAYCYQQYQEMLRRRHEEIMKELRWLNHMGVQSERRLERLERLLCVDHLRDPL
jgi:hypothetical protein